MNPQHHRRVWPAYVIAFLALFISLGGPAVAAALITGANVKDGSLAGIDVKNGSLAGIDVKDASLTSIDVKDGSLGSVDLSAAAKAALKGAPGQDGASGTAGACETGYVLVWMPLMLQGNGFNADSAPTLRIGRCYQNAMEIMGDGILQAGEQCDDSNVAAGDGCDPAGQLIGPKSIAVP